MSTGVQSNVSVIDMLELGTYVIATKVVTILAGGFVTLLAYRAYTRTGSPSLRALTAGLGTDQAPGAGHHSMLREARTAALLSKVDAADDWREAGSELVDRVDEGWL